MTGPNDPNHFARWADEGGYMLHFERDPNGAMLVTITGGPSGPVAATLANFRVKHLIDWLIPDSEAFGRGAASVMTIRCTEHATVPPLNENEDMGGECGACIAETLGRSRSS